MGTKLEFFAKELIKNPKWNGILELISCGPNQVPIIQYDPSSFSMDKATLALASEIHLSLLALGQKDEEVALVLSTINEIRESGSIRLAQARYSQIMALRKKGIFAPMLSGNALIHCEESNELVLHLRSSKSQDHIGLWHSFGGSIFPKSAHEIYHQIKKEVKEETALDVSLPQDPLILILAEPNIQYLQITVLNVDITAAEANQMQSNWEGQIHKFSYQKLKTLHSNPALWTPSGWFQTALWLKLNQELN